MVATDVYVDDAYAAYWDTIEADLDSPAPVAVRDVEDSTPQEVLDAYSEFTWMSEDERGLSNGDFPTGSRVSS